MANNTPQELVEYRMLNEIASGNIKSQQIRTQAAYRKSVKRVENNFPITF